MKIVCYKDNILKALNSVVKGVASKTTMPILEGILIQTNDKEIKLVSGNEAIEQAIKIRLSSALNSIRGNENIGSNLEEYIHELIDNKSLASSLKASIKNAISDIIPNPVIMLEKPKSKYVSYNTSFKVVIIDNDRQYSITF